MMQEPKPPAEVVDTAFTVGLVIGIVIGAAIVGACWLFFG